MRIVVPSGAERATRWPAMLVPPPLTFSTMKFCPNFAVKRCAICRASWSVGLKSQVQAPISVTCREG